MKKVKWAESAGARVVPIRYGSKPVELEAVFNGISGLLLPQYEDMVSNFAFPAQLGEVAFMLWLLVMGAREPVADAAPG